MVYKNKDIAPWSILVDDVLKSLDTSKKGVTSEEAEKRQKVYGKNSIEKFKVETKLKIFLNQLKSPLIFILIFAGVITLLLNDFVDSIFIFFAVFVNTALGFYQENKAENVLEHLKSYIVERVRVIRGGKEKEIDANDVVVGDIVVLSAGMRVPADARLIFEKDILVDESILTGESLPVKKQIDPVNFVSDITEKTNIIFGGTLIEQGICKAVVYSIGKETEFGKIAGLVSKKIETKTPLQKSIKKIALYIVRFVFLIVVAIFVLGIIRGGSILDMFLISVAVAVSAIPEGLPIALTVILAIGVEKLAKKNGVVKKLVSAEVLGSTTVILTDKTGTLTKSEMRISDIVIPEQIISNSKIKYSGEIRRLSREQKDILKMALLNTDVLIENEREESEKWEIRGRPLEVSLVREAGRLGMKISNLMSKAILQREKPFNSKDKFSSVRIKDLKKTKLFNFDYGDDIFIFFGAPEILLNKSDVSKDEYVKLSEYIEKLAYNGERILGVAIANSKNGDLDKVKNIKFVGIIGFSDPLREDVKKAMDRVNKYGIKVAIVTGDHKGTAISVAKQLGWDIKENNVLEGFQIKELSDKELESQLDKIKIFARVSPEDKVRIVKLFKNKKEVVAMTGDGVNDAPSLKMADIGIAVEDGTDVSKDVADLIILDNKFNTIVYAIEEGRKILSNIRKTVVYLLSDILDEVSLIGGSLIFGLVMPLNALQILWVNFFSDSFPAIAYAFDDNKGDYEGTSNNGGIFNKEVKYLIFIIGSITSILLFILYWILSKTNINISIVRTFIFATFGIYTLLLSLSLRGLKKSILEYNIFGNKYLIVGVALGIIMMIAAIYMPFLQNIFNTISLPFVWWVGVLGFSLFNIFLVEIIKFIFRKIN